MRYRSRTVLVVAAASFLLLGLASAASAAETAGSELVIISEDDVIVDDLYAAGSRVIIDGTLDGDLIAFAGEDILIRGEVTGSVYAVAPVVKVEGQVGRSLRSTGDSLEVTGTVGHDVVAAVRRVEIGETSAIGNDVVLWAWAVTAEGSIGGTLSGTMRSLDLAGSVEGDVDVTVSRLSVTDSLEVSGDLGYRSDDAADGLDQASVGGAVVKKTPRPPNIRVRALNLLARMLVVMLLTGTALLVAWGWPAQTDRAGSAARASWLKAYGWGALVILSPLILSAGVGLILALAPASASLPLLAIFAPVILALLGIVLALSLVAGVPAVVMLGQLLPGRYSVYGSIVVGSVVVGIAWLTPLIGPLVPLLALPLGMGGWIIGWKARERGGMEDTV
jgi:hypothetical protein